MIHGMQGKVVCQDQLSLPKPSAIFYINEVRYPFPSGMYSIRVVYPKKEEKAKWFAWMVLLPSITIKPINWKYYDKERQKQAGKLWSVLCETTSLDLLIRLLGFCLRICLSKSWSKTEAKRETANLYPIRV